VTPFPRFSTFTCKFCGESFEGVQKSPRAFLFSCPDCKREHQQERGRKRTAYNRAYKASRKAHYLKLNQGYYARRKARVGALEAFRRQAMELFQEVARETTPPGDPHLGVITKVRKFLLEVDDD
jgi:hypothetical protein